MQMNGNERSLSPYQRFVGRGVLLAAFLVLFGALGDGVSHASAETFSVPAGTIAAT